MKQISDLAGPDGKLVHAVEDSDIPGISAALAAGANPNVTVCEIPFKGRAMHALADSTECKGKASLNLSHYLVRSDNSKQEEMTSLLVKSGMRLNVSPSEALEQISKFSLKISLNATEDSVVQDKVKALKALSDNGIVFSDADIRYSLRKLMSSSSGAIGLKAVKELASYLGKEGLISEAQLEYEKERKEKERRDIEAAKRAEADRAARIVRQKAVLEAANRHIRTVGNKVCRTIINGYVSQKSGVPGGSDKYVISGVTEVAGSENIQVRIISIRRELSFGATLNVNALSLDSVLLQANALFWDSPDNWVPCRW